MKPQTRKLWIEALVYGLLLTVFSCIYQFIQARSFTLYTLQAAFSFSGIILINLSFILSGVSYFWHIGIKKLGHRKQYGVVGFVLVLIHALLSLQLYAGSIFSLSLFMSGPVIYISALCALIIFTMMVIVSNFGIPAKIGVLLWRQLLRVGYIGIVLFTIHLFLLRYITWIRWFNTFNPLLPPLSLFLFLFSAAAVGLRMALFIALKKRATSQKNVSPPPSPSPTPSTPPGIPPVQHP